MLLFKSFDQHIERATNKASDLIKSRYGLWFLGILSFAESALLVPIITDPFMVAYILVHRTRAIATVAVTILTSVLGGFIAYITAAFFIDLIMPLLSLEAVTVFQDMIQRFHNDTFLLAFLGAVTPLPFTLAALAAGTIKGNILFFLLGSLAGRTLRYGIVGYLTYHLGDHAVGLIRKNIVIISILTILATVMYIWFKM